jgi:hypothetical protein
MTAISKAWVTIADGAVDPDSPVDTALMTAIRDNQIHQREWLGASYTAGAVQDHNHDGSNSALIEVGPNSVRNGGFERGLEGWTATQYSGGTVVVGTSNAMEGEKALAITSTVLANGGGQVLQNEFVPVGLAPLAVSMLVKASTSGVSCKAELVWYDAALSQISATELLSLTNTPTVSTVVALTAGPPATARFWRMRLTGGVPAVGTAFGTIYFDAVRSAERTAGGIRRWFSFTPGTYDFIAPSTTLYVKGQGAGGSGGGITNDGDDGFAAGGGSGGYRVAVIPVVPGRLYQVRVGAGGLASFGLGNGGESTRIVDSVTSEVVFEVGGGTGGQGNGNGGSTGTLAGGSAGSAGSNVSAAWDPGTGVIYSVTGQAAPNVSDPGGGGRFGGPGARVHPFSPWYNYGGPGAERTTDGNGNPASGVGHGGAGAATSGDSDRSGGPGAPGAIEIAW